jgi:hypothetical protein
MSRTTTPVDIANKDDAKTLVETFIDQDEQISKIEISFSGGAYSGALTVNDPPTPPAVGDQSMASAKTAAVKALDDGKSKITIERNDSGVFTVTAV